MTKQVKIEELIRLKSARVIARVKMIFFRNENKDSSTIDINRGKMTQYVSTLPSQFNELSNRHTPPIMGETVEDIKPRSSCCISVGTGVGVSLSINKNKSKGCTSGVMLNSHCIAINEDNVQVLNSNQLSFKHLQQEIQERYNKDQDGFLVRNIPHITSGNGFERRKQSKKPKVADADGVGFPTLCESLDSNYGHIYPSHIHVGGDAYGIDYGRSSPSLKSVCHSFNRLLKEQCQGSTTNSDMYHCQGYQGSSGTHCSLQWPFLDEWNEYEMYKKEQECRMPLLPTCNYIV